MILARSLRLLLVFTAFVTVSLIPMQPASAASFIVTKTADTNDGVCNADCSLREAITAANSAAGTDTITFDAAVFNPGTIILTSSLPAINTSINIDGASQVTIDGGGAFRHFEIVLSTTDVTLDGLTLTNGSADEGGAIKVFSATLAVINCVISDNMASTHGGAIYVLAPSLTLIDSTISGNATAGNGGGMYFFGTSIGSDTLTITNSVFSGNTATGLGGGLYQIASGAQITGSDFINNEATGGGGILVFSTSLTLTESTLDDNTASEYGGGLSVNNAQTINVLHSAVTNNTAGIKGGGIYDFGTTLNVINTTIAGNAANAASGSGSDYGGGAMLTNTTVSRPVRIINSTIANNTSAAAARSGIVLNSSVNAPVTIQNSIIASNSGTNNCIDGGVNLIDGGNNIDNGTTCAFGGPFGQNINPFLNPLANNGGPTRTLLPQSGSVAINGGDNTKAVNETGAALTTDQRGTGYPRILSGTVDIGAVETGCPPSPHTVPPSDTFNLVNAINCANSSVGSNVINLTDSTYLFGAPASGVNALPPILNAEDAGTLTINGNGATIARSGRVGVSSFRLFLVSAGGNLTLNELTLVNGKTDALNPGGALRNDGTLALNGITISGSTSGTGGGALYNSGTVAITGSTFTGNSSSSFGGAIANFSATLFLINSTIVGNSANGSGAGDGGGALDTFGAASSVQIRNTTIANNTATLTPRSGIWVEAGTLVIQNTILSGNGGANNCVVSGGMLTDGGNNLDSGATCSFGATSLSNANANLAGLADNGGPTQTMALLPGSAAINAGSNLKALDPTGSPLTTDQRGTGFARIVGGTVDIGAYEAVTGTLNVQLVLQGRSVPAPHASYAITTHVWIMPQAGGTPLYMQDFTSSTSAAFTVPNVPVGTYLFRFKGSHTLARQYVITISSGANAKTTDILLEGDATDNNGVTLPDFSLLAASFGKSLGAPGYNPTVDFNGDNQVNLIDFSLLASNFGKAGDGGVTS